MKRNETKPALITGTFRRAISESGKKAEPTWTREQNRDNELLNGKATRSGGALTHFVSFKSEWTLQVEYTRTQPTIDNRDYRLRYLMCSRHSWTSGVRSQSLSSSKSGEIYSAKWDAIGLQINSVSTLIMLLCLYLKGFWCKPGMGLIDGFWRKCLNAWIIASKIIT